MDPTTFAITIATAGSTGAIAAGGIKLVSDVLGRRAHRSDATRERQLAWVRERVQPIQDLTFGLVATSAALTSVAKPEASLPESVRSELADGYEALHDRFDELDERLEAASSAVVDLPLLAALQAVGIETMVVRKSTQKLGPYLAGDPFDWSGAHRAHEELKSAVRVASHRVGQLVAGDPVRPGAELIERMTRAGVSLTGSRWWLVSIGWQSVLVRLLGGPEGALASGAEGIGFLGAEGSNVPALGEAASDANAESSTDASECTRTHGGNAPEPSAAAPPLRDRIVESLSNTSGESH